MARRPTPTETPAEQQQATSLGHVIDLVRENVPPVHPAGRPFVLGLAALAVLGRRRPLVRRTATLAALACGGFFREPHRVPPQRPGIVVAPADGTIALVDTAVPPAELGMREVWGEGAVPRVSVFLSVLDVHVQRGPVRGTVRRLAYQAGKFLSADLPAASDKNERNSMWLRTDDGHDLVVVQIAGLIARRIVCEVAEGEHIERGQTYGMIRFGSRVDTYLPPNSRVLVDVGQRTVGAETVLAELP
ncbi:MAG: phosphatidylserine decarboxylase [Mycobacteriaceae bacterium]